MNKREKKKERDSETECGKSRKIWKRDGQNKTARTEFGVLTLNRWNDGVQQNQNQMTLFILSWSVHMYMLEFPTVIVRQFSCGGVIFKKKKSFEVWCWTWPSRCQISITCSLTKLRKTIKNTKRWKENWKQRNKKRSKRCSDTNRRHGGRKRPRWEVAIPTAIIVCYRALPYITDRPSQHCTSAAVLLNPRGNPPLPIQITLHRAQGSDVASDREHTNPGPQPHRPAQRRPGPAVSSLWKNIFECLVHSLTISPHHHHHHHMLLSFRWGFYERGGGVAQNMPAVVTSCSEGMHTALHRVSLLDRRFW